MFVSYLDFFVNDDNDEANLLDGGGFRLETKSVGAFNFLENFTKLELPEEMINQMNLDRWSEFETIFGDLFLTKSRDEWSEIFRFTLVYKTLYNCNSEHEMLQ